MFSSHAAGPAARARGPAGGASAKLRVRMAPSRPHGPRGRAVRRRHRRHPARRGRPTNSTVPSLRPSMNSRTSRRSPTRHGRRSSEHLDEHQRMDLVFTIGCYGALAMAINTFGVEPDLEMQREVDNRGISSRSRTPAAGPRTGRNSAPRRSTTTTRSIPSTGSWSSRPSSARPGCNIGRVELTSQEGQLLHPRAAVGRPGHVGRSSSTTATRSVPSTTCAAIAATSWCGTTIPAKKSRAPAVSSSASTTPGATTSRAT